MRKKTILLVEDDEVVQDVVPLHLENKYRVVTASSCSAVKDLLLEDIDLAIVDYSLPDGNGFEVVNIVRTAKPYLPAILMTAYSN